MEIKEEGKKEEGKKGEAKSGEEEKVELPVSTYALLLDKLDELEGKLEAKGGKEGEKDPLDDLAKEGKEGKEGEANIDDMSNSEVFQLVQETFTKDLGNVMVAVNEVRFSMDIDKLTRPKEMGGEGIKDLYDYEEDIMTLMSENPKMSIKRAYTLASVENPKNKEGEKKEERTPRLRDLLPKTRIHGERPGPSETSIKEGEPDTLDDAAKKAAEEAFGK